MKRVLVIGSNSFTGAHLVNYLIQSTDCDVVGISRSPEFDPVFLPVLYRKTRSGRYTFHQIDINRDLDRFMDICDNFRPEGVVNYAAQGEVRSSWQWPEQWYQTNCLGVVRLSERLKDREYLEKYVAVSTPEVYGTTGDGIKESHLYHPSTPYAASKLAGDLHLFALHKRHGFPVVFTRAANLYGIHQQLYRIIPRAIIRLKQGRPIELHGRGESRRAFIHARDVAVLTFRALTMGRAGEVYHLAPDDGPRSIREVVEFICRLTGSDCSSSVRLVDENFGQDMKFSLDASKARQEFGWSQQIGFEDGVKETVEWIESNWNFIRTQPMDYVHKE